MDQAEKRRAYNNDRQNKYRAAHRAEVLAKQRDAYAERKATGRPLRPQPKRDAANKRSWHQVNKEKQSEQNRKWYLANWEKAKQMGRESYHRNKEARNARRYTLRRADPLFALKMRAKYHRVSFAQLKTLVTAQAGKCAICASETRLHIDHDHKTMAVRGLLCRACNTGIGLLQERPEILLKAVSYLQATVL